MPRFFTRKGDDGNTGLVEGGRIPKHELHPRTCGTLDEAPAALDLARSLASSEETRQTPHHVQHDLYHPMAEVAATAEKAEHDRTIDSERVEWLEAQIDMYRYGLDTQEFVLEGETILEAAIDLARSIVRRAKRLVAKLQHEGELTNPSLLRYLNRLPSLCFVLLLRENGEVGVDYTTRAKVTEP